MRKNLDIIVWGSAFLVAFFALAFGPKLWTDQDWSSGLAALMSVVTAAATMVLAVGVWLAWKTLGVQQAQKYAEGLFHMHQILMTPDFVNARRHIRANRKWLTERRVEQWASEDLRCADLVCASYDQAGLLIIEANLLGTEGTETFLDSSWGDSIVTQYDTLIPYLDADDGGGPRRDFFRHFVDLHELSAARRPGAAKPSPSPAGGTPERSSR